MRLNAGEYRGEDTSSDEEDAANAGQKKKKKGKKKVIDIEQLDQLMTALLEDREDDPADSEPDDKGETIPPSTIN